MLLDRGDRLGRLGGEGKGQVETDEVYVGVDKGGLSSPVQSIAAKRSTVRMLGWRAPAGTSSSGGLGQCGQCLAQLQRRQGVALAVGAEGCEGLLALPYVVVGEGALV